MGKVRERIVEVSGIAIEQIAIAVEPKVNHGALFINGQGKIGPVSERVVRF